MASTMNSNMVPTPRPGPTPTSSTSIADHRPILPDMDKPPMPYVVGARFHGLQHVPSPPLLLPYEQIMAPLPARFQGTTQLELCLTLRGRPVSMFPSHVDFTLLEGLAVGDGRGPQVFRISDQAVVKIYDPLYYPAVLPCGLRSHVVNQADRDHNNEVSAYLELAPRFAGAKVPGFIGCYTISIPTKTPTGDIIRQVRVALVEYIRGWCMNEVDPTRLQPQMTNKVMKYIIETDMQFLFHGIRMQDLAPSNVILVGEDEGKPYDEQTDFRAVLIDFNNVAVGRHAIENVMRDRLAKPLSPVAWHASNSGLLDKFVTAGWIPHADYIPFLQAMFGGSNDYVHGVYWTPYNHVSQMVGPPHWTPPALQYPPDVAALEAGENELAAAPSGQGF